MTPEELREMGLPHTAAFAEYAGWTDVPGEVADLMRDELLAEVERLRHCNQLIFDADEVRTKAYNEAVQRAEDLEKKLKRTQYLLNEFISLVAEKEYLE